MQKAIFLDVIAAPSSNPSFQFQSIVLLSRELRQYAFWSTFSDDTGRVRPKSCVVNGTFRPEAVASFRSARELTGCKPDTPG
jgi:hypothetical protein